MQGKKVLVVDDDLHISHLIEIAFTTAGADVIMAADGQEGLRQFYDHKPDLVILDLMMPELDGWETSQRMLELAEVPIIMLTSLGEDEDIIRGLEQGAIDYVTKPFAPRVLVARAKAALRHTGKAKPAANDRVYWDGYLTIDLHEKRVLVKDVPVKLTKTEYKLLAYLFHNAGQILTFQQILQQVWGWEYQDSIEYVHVYVSRLRQKLENDPKEPLYLLTEYGTGYRFEKHSS